MNTVPQILAGIAGENQHFAVCVTLQGHTAFMAWTKIDAIETARLVLEPLTVPVADEMFALLSDPVLYEYTGGQPPTLEQLREQYSFQVAGKSADGQQQWLNWIIRWQISAEPAGYVQATVENIQGVLTAEIAWVVGVAHQRQGVAVEASAGMIDWLSTSGVRKIVAHIHPDHEASMLVARRLELLQTDSQADGEVRLDRAL